MKTSIINDKAKLAFGLGALLIALLVAAYIFRDSFGLFFFLIVGFATLIQFLRVVVRGGGHKTLKDLWSAFRDAFWGIG
ncbi:hypothetical protein [[Pseudomonas] boreopolis]|uniref:hypothetical protein n=1 Tax=Xanthomonas boreopolis TaxID=86183 RepID=UPI003DA028BB